MAGRLGIMIAVKATAHKLARLVYVDRGMEADEHRYRERTLEHLSQRAATLGYRPTPTLSLDPAKSTLYCRVSRVGRVKLEDVFWKSTLEL